jgi:hypothetical protein
MDRLIKETLADKAGEIEVPAGAWEQVRRQIAPLPARPFGFRYRLGAGLELMAAVAVLLLVVGVGLWRSAPGAGEAGIRTVPPGLTVKETVLAAERDVAGDLVQLRGLTPASPPDDRTKADRLKLANEALAPFGYRLAQAAGSGFDLYRGSEVVLAGFPNFGPVSVAASGDDFVFRAFNPAEQDWLVQAGGVREWEHAEVMRHDYQPPVYVGDDLVAVRWEDALDTYAVWRGNEQVFTVPLTQPAFGNEVKRLVSWAGHWVLEVQGDVYVDGTSLRQQFGYDEVFEWRLVGGRPFYLFRKGPQVGVAYDGQVLPYQYEQVPHYLCCEPSQLNPIGGDSGVRFYGLRRGDWYWVEVAAVTADGPHPNAKSDSASDRLCVEESRPAGPLLVAPCQESGR